MPPLFTLNRSSPRRDYAPGFTKSDSCADRGRPCCRPRGSAYVDRQPIPHEGRCRGGPDCHPHDSGEGAHCYRVAGTQEQGDRRPVVHHRGDGAPSSHFDLQQARRRRPLRARCLRLPPRPGPPAWLVVWSTGFSLPNQRRIPQKIFPPVQPEGWTPNLPPEKAELNELPTWYKYATSLLTSPSSNCHKNSTVRATQMEQPDDARVAPCE